MLYVSSSSKPSGPPSGGYQAPAAPRAPAASTPGTWQPKVPTGERHMKVGRVGDARSMPATSGGGRIPMCGSCGIAIRCVLEGGGGV